jgi:hypothetical protein
MKTCSVSLKTLLVASTAVCALTLGLGGAASFSPFMLSSAQAQESGHSGGKGGSGGHEDGGEEGGHEGGSEKGKGGTGEAGGHRGNIEDKVFDEDEGPSDEAKGPHYGGGKDVQGKPAGAGSKKGDLFGDMVVILRDENGVPVLTPEGYVQPLDAEGNPLPLNEEGEVINPDAMIEVELGRSNVARSPSKVLEGQLDEVIAAINAADSVTLDESGRIVTTTDGEEATVDSPIANLALYKTILNTGTIEGVDASKLPAELANLADGVKTDADLLSAIGFLAGATDKEGALSVDEIVYLNSILGIEGTITGADGRSYIDYSNFTYDRSSTYDGVTVTVLVETSPGVFEMQTVNVMDAVFGGADASGEDVTGYTQAADDARSVLLFVHDNSAPE